MGFFIHFLKNWERHSQVKMMRDIAEIAFNINACYYYYNDKHYFPDGTASSFSIFIKSGTLDANVEYTEEPPDEPEFLLVIEGLDPERIEESFDKQFDYLIPGKKLCSLAYINKLRPAGFELFYHFCYEYLKKNPDEYIYLDSYNRPFGWEDMQKLSTRPYDDDWLFKGVI